MTEKKTRNQRRLTLPMPETVRVEVERVIDVLGLPRKTVVEAAADIAAEAVGTQLASRLGKAKLEAAQEEVRRLKDALNTGSSASAKAFDVGSASNTTDAP